ncbi:hypothetical protein QP166_14415 [Sphingomonas sp. LR60]|uniref:hypothetical protein n=1 Tax=Sphingomonas sp. LR60 TaxID=3050233 RepID=UPI002FDF16E5
MGNLANLLNVTPDELRGPDASTLRHVAWIARSKAKSLFNPQLPATPLEAAEAALQGLANELDEIAATIEACGITSACGGNSPR